MRNQTILVDINKETCKILKYKQYDNNNILQIIVEENYKKINLNEYVGFAFFELPSGLIIKKECEIEDNVITIIIDNNILSEEGKVLLDLTLSDGEDIFTLFRINLVIEETIDRDEAIIIEAGWDIVAEIAKFDKAEEQRVTNEERRVDYENVRIANESDRQNEEMKRIANENVRVVKESERLINELERIDAEEQRIENEELRRAEENERLINEQGRVEAEVSRATRFNKMETIVSGVEGEIIEIQNDMNSARAQIDSVQDLVSNHKHDEYLPLRGGTIIGDLSANCFESIRTVESADGGGTIGSVTETRVFTDQYGQGRIGVANTNNQNVVSMIINPHDRSFTVDGTVKPAGGDICHLGNNINRWNTLYCHAIDVNDCYKMYCDAGTFHINTNGMDFFFQNDTISKVPCFRPKDNATHLGHEAHRWNAIYLVTAPDVSSDRVMKENIEYVGKAKSGLTYEELYNFVKDDLGLATYNFIGDDKLRMNFIAQDLLANEDGTDNKIGQMIVNPVAVPTEEEIAEGKPYPTLSFDTGMYISVLAGALKEAINKIEQLEVRINELENKNEEK